MKNYCIKVKRKGFNFYTDYMERYFDKVVAEYGLHLTKRKEQADIWCVAFVSEPQRGESKYMTFISPVLSKLASVELVELTQLIGVCFKSESKLEEADDVLEELAEISKTAYVNEDLSSMRYIVEQGYGSPELFMFSKEYSSFIEPVFITQGDTVFKKCTQDIGVESGRIYHVGVLNIGGPSKGLTVDVSFSNTGEVRIENQRWSIWENNSSPTQSSFEFMRIESSNKIVYHADLPDFDVHCGFNEYSTKLCGKGKMNAADKCEIDLLFTPYGNEAVLREMEVTITPIQNPESEVVFKPILYIPTSGEYYGGKL